MRAFKKIISVVLVFAFILSVLPVAKEAKADTGGDKKLICIDPGHQLKANLALEPIGPGASKKKYKVTGGTTGVATKVPEYKLALTIAKKLKKELEKRGYEVVMTRTKNKVNISNKERAKIANKAGADAFIRIHANAGGSSAKGALTIAPTKNNPYLTKKNRNASRKFSKVVLKKYCKATGAKNLGVMYTDTMSGINWSEVPVTIIEMGFMSNSSEDKKMQKSSYQKKIVKGIADGIDAYLG